MTTRFKIRDRKPRKRGRLTVLICSIVLLIAGAAAIVVPIMEENASLSRDEAEYQELADELKREEDFTEVPMEEAPQTTEPHENGDSDQTHLVIHPPDEIDVSTEEADHQQEHSTSEEPFPAMTDPAQSDLHEPTTFPQSMPTVTKTPSSPFVTEAPGSTDHHPSEQSAPESSPVPKTTDEPKPPPPTPRPGNTGANLDACLAKNPEFIAWLKIPGTAVDYPVVLSDNVDFYLDHSFTGAKSKLGTLFSLGKTDYKTPGRNIAIYGHHITNTSGGQKMFRPLLSYKQKSFWERHQTIWLDSRYHIGVYRVFAVIEMVSGDWDPSQASFASETAFLRFVDNARENALYDTGVEVSAGDHILTLITCDRSFAAKAGRLVVMAVEEQN